MTLYDSLIPEGLCPGKIPGIPIFNDFHIPNVLTEWVDIDTHTQRVYIYKIDGLIVCILSHEYTEYTLYLPIPANSIIFHHPPGSLKTIVPGSRERPSHVRGQAHGPIGPPSSP